MSVAESKKVLKRMEKFLDGEAARKVLDKHKQRVWMYNEDVAKSFKEGYALVYNRRASEANAKNQPHTMPQLDDDFFDDVAVAAIAEVVEYLEKPRTKGWLVSNTTTYISFDQDRYIAAPFTALKRKARELINQKLKSAGIKQLTAHKAESGKQGSEAALLAQGTQRLHKTKRSVGALQLLGALEWANQSPKYNKFSSVENIKSMAKALGQIELEFYSAGYTGKGGSKVKYNPNLRVSIFVSSHKDNPAGDLPTDWATIKPKLEEELQKFIVEEGIADVKGSNSIREDARKHARHLVISKLRKRLRVVSDSKPVSRKEKSVKTANRESVGKKRKAFRSSLAYTTIKTGAGNQQGASLYTVMAMINEKLPETVRKNMGAPALENQTGRFANSVKMTDVIKTPKGYPSFGYTYAKQPYQVFETGSQGTWSTPERDPRVLIDRSIREIAAGFALGRFYTRRE
tara:strand:- start:6880 stop:8256 length:1377 start_codon:yes stop_codon:yes gene_type:complete